MEVSKRIWKKSVINSPLSRGFLNGSSTVPDLPDQHELHVFLHFCFIKACESPPSHAFKTAFLMQKSSEFSFWQEPVNNVIVIHSADLVGEGKGQGIKRKIGCLQYKARLAAVARFIAPDFSAF